MNQIVFYAPAIFGSILLLLALGLLLSVRTAVRRRETWRVRWLCLLYGSSALTVGAGFPLTSLQPNERAADVACGEGAAMVVASIIGLLWTAFGAHASRPR